MRLLQALLIIEACFAGALAAGACTPSAGTPSAADVSAFASQQLACVDDYDARAPVDACRTASRTAFCTQYPSLTLCSTDAGGDQ